MTFYAHYRVVRVCDGFCIRVKIVEKKTEDDKLIHTSSKFVITGVFPFLLVFQYAHKDNNSKNLNHINNLIFIS